jgi:ribosomal protein L29
MTASEFEELEKRYFLIRRNTFWWALGGAVSFLAVVGFVSWQGAMQAIRSSAGQQAIKEIQTMHSEATNLTMKIRNGYSTVLTNQTYFTNVVDQRILWVGRREELRKDQIKLESELLNYELERISKELNKPTQARVQQLRKELASILTQLRWYDPGAFSIIEQFEKMRSEKSANKEK